VLSIMHRFLDEMEKSQKSKVVKQK